MQFNREPEYTYLKEGEIIEEGDEVLHESKGWIPAVNSVGKPAPSPKYTSHRQFRRIAECGGCGRKGGRLCKVPSSTCGY